MRVTLMAVLATERDTDNVVRTFLKATLFFELNRAFVEDRLFYICYSLILSKCPDSPGFVQRLSAFHYAQFFNYGTSHRYISNNNICKLCGRYTKLVTFGVYYSSN